MNVAGNDDARRVLSDVPPGGTPEFREWVRAVRALGPGANEAFLNALAEGSENEQYGALLGLRVLGYEAWGVGGESITHYAVKGPDDEEPRIIVPSRPE